MIKILNLAKNTILSNFTEPAYPYRLTYIVTYKCQLKCNMCNIWQRPSVDELNLAEIDNFFKKSNQFSWINLSGGEIFLRKDILEIISSIHRNCKNLYVLDFPTNGFNTDLIVSSIKKIQDLKVPKLFVTISLDGPPDKHDEIRGVNGSWKRAVATFSKLKEYRSNNFNLFFGMTLQPSNIDNVDETVRSVRKEIDGVDYNDFHINIAHTSEHYYGNNTKIEKSDIQNCYAEMEKIMRLRKNKFLSPVAYLEKRYQRLSRIYFDTKKTPIPCAALASSFFMDPSGNVYPCSIFNSPIGNIRNFDYEIKRIWSTDRRKALRSQIAQNKCPQCWTPCEAYQSILANLIPKPIKVLRKALL